MESVFVAGQPQTSSNILRTHDKWPHAGMLRYFGLTVQPYLSHTLTAKRRWFGIHPIVTEFASQLLESLSLCVNSWQNPTLPRTRPHITCWLMSLSLGLWRHISCWYGRTAVTLLWHLTPAKHLYGSRPIPLLSTLPFNSSSTSIPPYKSLFLLVISTN